MLDEYEVAVALQSIASVDNDAALGGPDRGAGRHGDVDAVVAAGLEPLNDAAARRPAEFRLDAGRVGLRAGERNFRFRRAGLDVAGRREFDRRLLALRRLARFGIGDCRALNALGCRLRRVSGGLLGFGDGLVLRLRLGGFRRPSVGNVVGVLFLRLGRLSARDGVAVRVIDGHDDVGARRYLRGVREAIGLQQRGGRNAVTGRERIQRLALGDDDRRAADRGPPDRRTADGLRRGAGGLCPAATTGSWLPGRRDGESASLPRRARVGAASARLARKWIGERSAALGEACDVGRTARKQKKARPSQRETRESASFYTSNAITHWLSPTATQLQIRVVCADGVKGRFKMNRR